MSIIYDKELSDEERRVLARFQADIERLANDMKANVNVVSIGRSNDMPYVITQIERSFADAEDRVTMMADSLTWQAYQLGMAQGIFETSPIVTWNLDSSAEHCDTCLQYSAIRYFTKDTLPGIPGAAPTICDGGCKCYLT
jgi:hypothetical protein